MANKTATTAEKAHLSRVAALGCMVCRMPAQVHHCGTHLGGGRDHMRVIPLCVTHHTNGGYGVAIHAGKAKWQKTYGTEQELLDKVNLMLQGKF